MGLFQGSRNRKQEECSCGGSCDIEIRDEDKYQRENIQNNSSSDLAIKVFGPGCAKCKTLKENVMKALSDSGKQADFEYVTDMEYIAGAGIMSTPTLEINGKIVSSGRVLKPSEIMKIIQ